MQFLWFLKIDLLRFHRIYLLYDWRKLFLLLKRRLLRINSPNLCPNMIHTDALDFSGWHSKEVTTFSWRLVYNHREANMPILELWNLQNWMKPADILFNDMCSYNKSADYSIFQFMLQLSYFECLRYMFNLTDLHFIFSVSSSPTGIFSFDCPFCSCRVRFYYFFFLRYFLA